MTTFRLRVQLLGLSHKLKDEDKQEDTELDVIKSFFRNRMPAERYKKITKGYQLFAYLEDKQVISEDNLQALEAPLEACGRSGTLEGLLRGVGGETIAGGCPLRSGVLANLDMEVYSATDTSKVDGLYRQCLCRVGNGIATSDGSLAELVYLCPELPLNFMTSKTVCSAHELFHHLEQKGLICCWKLSYLYCRLSVLERKDLCKEVEQYADKARRLMPRITSPAQKKRSEHYVRAHSNPEQGEGSMPTLMKTKVSSLPPALLRLSRQGNVQQQESFTERDGAAQCAETTTQGSEDEGRRGVDSEVTDGPLIDHKPNNDKPVVHPGGGIDVTQDRSGLQQRNKMLREGERNSSHTRSPDASSYTAPDITFLNHRVYRCLRSVLLWNVPYGILCAVIVLVAVMMVIKFLVELSVCGCGTAVLNLLGRGMTHVCLPTIILHIMVRIAEDNRMSNMRMLSCSRESESVLEAVIQKLSSCKELEHLRGMSSVAERVNYVLNSKLSLIMSAALLQSMVMLTQVMYLGAANYPHFMGIASHVAAVCRAVMVVGAFFIHLVTGIAICLYLFEMRVREYLAHIVHMAREKEVDTVEQTAEEAREIILQRWRTFQTVMTFLSVVHTLLLVYSIWSSTPFRCCGDSVTFNEMELRQVPMSWLLWVIISLLCHTCVYNYYSFTAGRITAVTLQVFSLSLCLLDHTSPKWGLMIQITNVVYPCASLFWICVLACRNVYRKVLLSLGSVKKDHRMHSTLLWCILLTHTRFVFYASLTVVILFIVPIAVYNEYTLLTKGVHSV